MTALRDLMDLSGRRALVVGGGGHIGAITAEVLAELGADVAVADRDADAARTVASRLGGPGAHRAHHVDLADEAATRSLIHEVAEALGGLDVLIDAAAFVGSAQLPGWTTPLEEQSVDTWRRSLDVNLTAAFVLAQEALPLLRTGGVGSIVLFGSIYGVVGPDLRLYESTSMGSPAAYAAAKGGLLQLVRWLASVAAPAVRVNMISPGGVARDQDPTFVERYEARTPMRRMATEDDLRGAVAYLATPLSSYVTGHNLIVDGGWTVW